MTATGIIRKTLVVDGNNLLVRAVFAAKGGRVHLSNHDGVPTAALHIFINLLAKYVRQESPDNMVVCWDGGRSSSRTALFSEYKGQRAERPEEEDRDRPFSQAKEFLSLAGIHHVERPGVEADDLVAAHWAGKHSSERMVILSADKDFLQLLDGWTEQIRPGTGIDERWTRSRVRGEFGCTPEQYRLVMALMGDASDGIPGVPGFGLKTSVKMLSKYGWSLEALLDSNERKVLGARTTALRNLDLVSLPGPFAQREMYAPKFAPTTVISMAWPALEAYLLRYDLAVVRGQIATGSLWSQHPATDLARP